MDFLQHPLIINSFRHWLRLAQSGGGIDARYAFRAALVTALSPLSAPTRALERALYGRTIRETDIAHPPVFVLGHWRTGTTHLHNLLSQDPAMGFVSTFQAMAPETCLLGAHTIKPIMNRLMPKTRPMDNMAFAPDLPQEEEYAVCHVCPYSFYASVYFPRIARALFRNYVLFEDVSDQVIARWRAAYIQILKKATYISGGKRLVLKNPVNTARIPTLLNLFPEAKFVHIYRNPYTVFKSSVRLSLALRRLLPFQRITDDEIEETLLFVYREMMQRFFADRAALAPGQLVEIRFEDLERWPLQELSRVYETLALPGWDTARERVSAYLESLRGYRKNRFSIAGQEAERIEHHWGFAIQAWGYERP